MLKLIQAKKDEQRQSDRVFYKDLLKVFTLMVRRVGSMSAFISSLLVIGKLSPGLGFPS